MSAVLGLSCHYHDAAAALVVDGRIVAAVSEERFSRVRFDPSLPVHAARWCLERGGLTGADLDQVVFYEDPYARLERLLLWSMRCWPRGWRWFPRAMASQLGGKLAVLDRISAALGVPRKKVSHTDHHRSHAASGFFTSPFERAAVLTLDGAGEFPTTTISIGEGRELRRTFEISFPHSVGLLYAAITAFLGFEVNDGEYKVMGLSAYGKPRYREALDRVLSLRDDASFILDARLFADLLDPDRGFGPGLEALIGPPRPPGAWDLNNKDDLRYADIAASVQSLTEDAVLGLARRARAEAGCAELCMAGGVALNCLANARVAAEGPLYVHPAAGDAGGAVGAAILGALELGDPRPPYLADLGLGPVANVGRAADIAGHLGFKTATVDPASEAAKRLSAGEVLAWVQGGCEWGPRALGHRSILASPGIRGMKDRINHAVKQREPFRPFAPVVRAEDCARYFDGGPDLLTPFMTTVRRVRMPLPAITHIDGSARVQTVTDGPLRPVLDQVPLLLNTSLNAAGDPIVTREADALSFFLSRPVDALILGDLLVTR